MLRDEVNGWYHLLHAVLITPLYVRAGRDAAEKKISLVDTITGSKLPGRAEVGPRNECSWLLVLVGKWTPRCVQSCDQRAYV
jgi:hypothetical protein